MQDKHVSSPFETLDVKFIWGKLSRDNISGSTEANLFTMNDIDVVYCKDSHEYVLGIETIYQFNDEKDKINYLKDCLDAFTQFMVKNNFNITKKPDWNYVFANGTNSRFRTIEDCYATFKMFVNAYCDVN